MIEDVVLTALVPGDLSQRRFRLRGALAIARDEKRVAGFLERRDPSLVGRHVTACAKPKSKAGSIRVSGRPERKRILVVLRCDRERVEPERAIARLP